MNRRFGVVVLGVLLPLAVLAVPGEIIRQIPAPSKNATGLAFDGKALWVADHVLDELLALDPADGKIIKRLKSPAYRPAGLAFDGAELWCVDVLEQKLYRLRPADGLVTRVLPWPETQPRAIAFDGQALWVSSEKSRTLHRVDPEDGTTLAEIPFPGDSVDALTHDGRYLWVADRISDRLYALDPRAGAVVVILRAPGPYTSGLAWNGKELYAVDYQTDRITTLKRDDEKFLLQEEPRRSVLEFGHQIRNFGPDPIPRADVYLAVPQNLPSQTLLAPVTFEPAPVETLTDQWGQQVAHFALRDLKPGGFSTIRMKARLVSYALHYLIYPEQVQGLWKIPSEVRRLYLADGTKYDLKSPIIQRAVAEAVGQEKNPYWIARQIVRYVQDRMSYEMIGGWDVAPKVLARGTGSCSEYSYVTIAMCRAAGLPARYVGSLVVRRDDASFDDVYHRWVEVYLPPFGWVPMDPQRGDKPSEAQRAEAFGHLQRDFLITTHSGGGSRWLGWSYNHFESYSCAGRCKVDIEGIAEWSPDPGVPPESAASSSAKSPLEVSDPGSQCTP